MGITTILWDLDGVIADTAEAHFLAWSRFAKFHHLPYTKDIFRKTFGMNNQSILEFLFKQRKLDLSFNDLTQEKESIFLNLLEKNISIFPCAIELMTLLQSRGLRQIIASSAPAQNIQRIISLLNVDQWVPDFVSGDHLSGKPHPAIFQQAAKFLKAANEECLVIEDSPLGIQAAQTALMNSIGVASTFDATILSNADDVVLNVCSFKEKIHARGLNHYFSEIMFNHQRKATTILPN